MDGDALLSRLAVSLSIGLLIGLERGWRTRNEEDHQRAAGLRTFALSGLIGGVAGALAQQFDSAAIIGLAFLGFAGAFAAFHWLEAQAERNYSATSVIAGMSTFLLGVLAVVGDVAAAVAGAVAPAHGHAPGREVEARILHSRQLRQPGLDGADAGAAMRARHGKMHLKQPRPGGAAGQPDLLGGRVRKPFEVQRGLGGGRAAAHSTFPPLTRTRCTCRYGTSRPTSASISTIQTPSRTARLDTKAPSAARSSRSVMSSAS